MSKTIICNNFGGGKALDKYSGGFGEFSDARGFDIHSFPNRLYPLPSMANTTTGTVIGNIIVGSDGIIYGSGKGSDTFGTLFKSSDGSTWTEVTAGGGSAVPFYDFLMEYKRYSATKFVLVAKQHATYSIIAVDPINANQLATVASIANVAYIGQGYEMPKDIIAYIPYQDSSSSYIGTIAATWTEKVLTLPLRYKTMCLTHFGDYLVIPGTIFSIAAVPGSSVNTSVIWLWDRNSSTTLPNEVINWGNDSLHIVNNLNGVIIGISKYESQTDCRLIIKGYAGGQVEVIKEIPVIKDVAATPTITINPRVNFIHRNKMYFSVDIVGGSTSPSFKGLWSVGKNKNGQWAVNIERAVSTDGTDVSVIAAAYRLDYLHAVHTAEGTLVKEVSTPNNWALDYANTSYLETLVNPNMPEEDKTIPKTLSMVTCHYLPLPASGQVVMKYKVDGSDWITIFTETTDGAVRTKRTKPVTGQFRSGYNFEFRIESTGFAQITGFTYSYIEKTK